jgi:hypothetical protein
LAVSLLVQWAVFWEMGGRSSAPHPACKSSLTTEALPPVLVDALSAVPKELCCIVAGYAEHRAMTWSRAGERARYLAIEDDRTSSRGSEGDSDDITAKALKNGG